MKTVYRCLVNDGAVVDIGSLGAVVLTNESTCFESTNSASKKESSIAHGTITPKPVGAC